MRFDHFIANRLQISERAAKTRIARGEFSVNGIKCTDLRHPIKRFDEISTSDSLLQPALQPLYIALHKPAGILSATKDPNHTTVVDLIDHPDRESLHLTGRLDRASTGLVLLTNYSRWSERLSHPDYQVPKIYFVETDLPIPDTAEKQFADGFEFATEGIRTRPALLEKLGETKARVTLYEGRWHQIKRMFHRLDGIRLISLHRESIGRFHLGDLRPGEWREIESPFDFEDYDRAL